MGKPVLAVYSAGHTSKKLSKKMSQTSDDEFFNPATSSPEKEVPVKGKKKKVLQAINETYNVNNAATNITRPVIIKHPPYATMVEGVVSEHQKGKKGISKTKIIQEINKKYELEAKNDYVTKAIRNGLEKNIF